MSQLIRLDDKRSVIPSQLTLVTGNVMPFKVDGLGPDKHHLKLRSSDEAVFTVEVVSADDRQQEQRLNLRVANGLKTQKSARLLVATAAGEDLPGLAVDITIVPAFTLPSDSLDIGLLIRLLLLENLSPDDKGFVSIEETRVCMQWMRFVIDNRMAYPRPKDFAVTVTNPRLVDFIKAPGQFAGFQKYPELDSTRRERLTRIVNTANDGTNSKFELFRQYYATASAVTEGSDRGSEPVVKLYGFRTAGHDPPGGDLVEYQTKNGTTFFTLRNPAPAPPLPKEGFAPSPLP